MAKPFTPEAPPAVNTLPEQFAALQAQAGEMSLGLSHLQNQLKNHRHTGTQYSRVNNSDLFHTRPALALPGTTGTVTFDPRSSDVYTVTPTGNITLKPSTVPNGARVTLIVTTSGTTSYTITFSTGFTATGTLATGTTTAKVFTITFAGDGVNLREVARTVAMSPS